MKFEPLASKNTKQKLSGQGRNKKIQDELSSEESFQIEDDGLEDSYSQEEDEDDAGYLSKRRAPGRKQLKHAEEDDDLGWEEEYGYIGAHQFDEALMTERQRAKQERQKLAAQRREMQDDQFSVSKPNKKVKNIYNMEELVRKQQLDESRRLKQKEANDRLMEETVQKILNEFSNKKTKLSLVEKREKKRAELYQQKVIHSSH